MQKHVQNTTGEKSKFQNRFGFSIFMSKNRWIVRSSKNKDFFYDSNFHFINKIFLCFFIPFKFLTFDLAHIPMHQAH
jgi:hypothetical protein